MLAPGHLPRWGVWEAATDFGLINHFLRQGGRFSRKAVARRVLAAFISMLLTYSSVRPVVKTVAGAYNGLVGIQDLHVSLVAL
jgi:hypothetical protein